jgi:putative SOS response-associated peptidase YedK
LGITGRRRYALISDSAGSAAPVHAIVSQRQSYPITTTVNRRASRLTQMNSTNTNQMCAHSTRMLSSCDASYVWMPRTRSNHGPAPTTSINIGTIPKRTIARSSRVGCMGRRNKTIQTIAHWQRNATQNARCVCPKSSMSTVITANTPWTISAVRNAALYLGE